MRHFTLLILLAFLFSACVRNNPKPVWLKISAWELQENTDPTAEDPGDLTHKFTDAWVYVDNKLVGIFEVPCTIPVLVSGSAKSVRVYPTVRNNGIGETKKIYPFCKPYEVIMDLAEGQTYDINPVTHYVTQCHFWLEDFADPSIKLDPHPDANATLMRENDPSIALTGFYGHVHLSTSDSLWIASTAGEMHLPGGGSEVYLEVDYRNDNSLMTGLQAFAPTGMTDHPNIAMNPQSTSGMVWKKIYIDLRELVSYNVNATYFKHYFSTLIDGGKSSSDIYIDNIRVVYM